MKKVVHEAPGVRPNNAAKCRESDAELRIVRAAVQPQRLQQRRLAGVVLADYQIDARQRLDRQPIEQPKILD